MLGLSLSADRKLLFSCGVDSVVNVWDSSSLRRLFSLYSPFEVGDIFCVAYSQKSKTVFSGAQNSSIQWHHLSSEKISEAVGEDAPSSRKHRFFDSFGPGGVPAPQPNGNVGPTRAYGGQILTISPECYHAYAHKSYIYSILVLNNPSEDNPDQEVLVTADGSGTVKVWAINDLQEKKLQMLYKLKNKGMSIYSLAYKAPFLYAGMSNGQAYIYNLTSQQLVQKLDVGKADISQIQVYKGDVFCSSNDGQVDRINNRFAKVKTWQAHKGKILATAISRFAKRRLLITGANDNTIAFWDIADQDTASRPQRDSNDELFTNLRQFVAYRTVAKNPSCVGDCHEAANFLRKLFNAFGAQTSLVSPQEEVNPLLIAKFEASLHPRRKKTLLFYGHYDVVDAEEPKGGNGKWYADPFTLYPLNGYLYGRGVTDDKGPILAALYAVAELVQNDELACNVVFLIEGDEEAGSRGFRKAVRDHKEEIGDVDYILLSNSYWLDDHVPCLTFGMRGVVHANIEITSGKPDQHSGMDGKSQQHEPLKDLTVLVSSLIGPTGMDILIPRFYDTVDPLQPSELRAYKSIATALMAGHPEIKNEEAFTQSLMQRWREPNLTVHSITVPETKTAVTISSRAKATLSIRIVPSQRADEVASNLKKYVEQKFDLLDSRNSIKVSITGKADPWLGKVQSEIYDELREAIIEAWSFDESSRQFETSEDAKSPITSPTMRARGRRASALSSAGTFTAASTPHEPLFIREGGSIPAISFLEREFDAPAAMFPMGQASDNAHLDNERIRVENLYKGRDVLRTLFSRLGVASNYSIRNRASTITI